MKEFFKNRKMIGFVILVVAIATLLIIRRKKRVSTADDNSSKSGTTGDTLPSATFPLRPYGSVGVYSAEKGSYGLQIAELQKLCNKKYGAGLDIDGKWGPKTDEVFRSRLGTLLFPGGISEAQYKVFLNQ